MKLFRKSLILAVAMVAFICSGASAQVSFNVQGKVLVPGVISQYVNSVGYLQSYLILSNITDHDVRVKVTYYGHDGQDMTSLGVLCDGSYSAGYGTVLQSTDGEFTIPAYGTRHFGMQNRPSLHCVLGHATVAWNSDDPKMTRALIGVLRYNSKNGNSSAAGGGVFPINNGQPW
ncbi:hypothetical protein [Maridesulfovibrio sp.]|uniref:hypothetical protein n=1 Tax=Maridesulfovibrio sp. TaxID=2795000 RepID=UPI0039EF242D